MNNLNSESRAHDLGETLNDWLNRLPDGAMEYLERVVEDYEAALIWVCIDCLQAIANGDYTGLDAHYEPDESEHIVEAINRGLEQLDNPTPGKRTREFINAKCDCCGTTRAGSRHEVIEAGRVR